jgi:beta-lactamase class A
MPTATLTPSSTPTELSLSPIAQKYIATNEPDAIRVAKQLNYLAADGHPSNMGGPLALAILRDAGVVSDTVNLHDFWLLNPIDGAHLLETTFPRSQFLWFQTSTPINAFDFAAFPLQTGDLLYLAAGKSGTFNQFLVVTRVDAAGRAFTVTSRNTPQGYVIDEMAMADLFTAWTDRQNSDLGLTGFGGFWLWRQRQVVGNTPEERLAHAVNETLITYGGDWQVIIQESGGKVLFAQNATQSVHIASVIKIPIALLFLKSVEDAAASDLNAYLNQTGTDGRTYIQLLEAMLVRSEEDATDSMEKALNASGLDVQATLAGWGAADTNLVTRHSTAQDVALLLEKLYTGELVSEQARTLMLGWLNTYTPNDQLRLGSLSEKVPGVTVYNKRGTLTEPLLIVADAGLIIWQHDGMSMSYEIVAMARNSDTAPIATYERLDQAIAEIADWFARYLGEK